MYIVPLAVECIYGWSDEGGEDGDGKEGSEIPGEWEKMEIAWPLLYADDFELEEEMRAMVGLFSLNIPSQYQSLSSAAYPLNNYSFT